MTKTIYLVRHGEYGYGRVLVRDGIEQIMATSQIIRQELNEAGIERVAIYHSPQLRAKQSAEVMKAELRPAIVARLIQSEYLDLDCTQVHRLADIINEGVTTIFISHQPDLEDFADQADVSTFFPKGGFQKAVIRNCNF